MHKHMSLSLKFLRFLKGRGLLFASVSDCWDLLCVQLAIRAAAWQSRGRGEGTCGFCMLPWHFAIAGRGSQNHRIVGVGRDLCGSSSPALLPKQGHLQQAAQDQGLRKKRVGESWASLVSQNCGTWGPHHNNSNYRQKREGCSTSDFICSHEIYSSSSFSAPAPSRHLSSTPEDPCASIWKWNFFGCIVNQLMALNKSRPCWGKCW